MTNDSIIEKWLNASKDELLSSIEGRMLDFFVLCNIMGMASQDAGRLFPSSRSSDSRLVFLYAIKNIGSITIEYSEKSVDEGIKAKQLSKSRYQSAWKVHSGVHVGYGYSFEYALLKMVIS